MQIMVKVPTNMNDKQKQADQAAGGYLRRHDVTPQENKGFFDKVKDAFGV